MYMPLFAKNLCFDIIMYVFLSFFRIYVVLSCLLLEATDLALSQKVADDLKVVFVSINFEYSHILILVLKPHPTILSSSHQKPCRLKSLYLGDAQSTEQKMCEMSLHAKSEQILSSLYHS